MEVEWVKTTILYLLLLHWGFLSKKKVFSAQKLQNTTIAYNHWRRRRLCSLSYLWFFCSTFFALLKFRWILRTCLVRLWPLLKLLHTVKPTERKLMSTWESTALRALIERLETSRTHIVHSWGQYTMFGITKIYGKSVHPPLNKKGAYRIVKIGNEIIDWTFVRIIEFRFGEALYSLRKVFVFLWFGRWTCRNCEYWFVSLFCSDVLIVSFGFWWIQPRTIKSIFTAAKSDKSK